MKLVKLSHTIKSQSYNLWIDPADVSSLTEAEEGSVLKLKNGDVFNLDITGRSAAKIISGDSSSE